jgi:hypothetical protein
MGRGAAPRGLLAAGALIALCAILVAILAPRLFSRQLARPSPGSVAEPSGAPALTATGSSGLRVATRDGLGLEVRPDGSVARTIVGGRVLPALQQPGGFSIRMVGGNPNLLPNSSLEADADHDGAPDGWRFTRGAAVPRVDGSTAHSGRSSVRVSNASVATSGALTTEVPASPYQNYFLSAWFKSEDVLPTATSLGHPPIIQPTGSPLQIRVEQVSGSGKVLATYYAFGYTNTADWNKQAVGFKTLGKTRTLRVSALLLKGSGTAWFDDLYLGQLFAPSAPIGGGVVAGTDGRLVQKATMPDQQLAFDATYTPFPDRIRVDATVTDTARENTLSTDKGFQITYTLPIDAVGWRWGDYVRASRKIEPSVPYFFNTNQIPEPSRYPFAMVYDARSSLSLAMPLNTPRFCRFRYDSRQGLSMTFDLGVSKAATKLGGKATLTFYIYTSDKSWGFRAATKKYYDLQPEAFVRRTDPSREGGWFIKPNLKDLDNPKTPQDESRAFGLGLGMVTLGTDSTQKPSTWGTEYLAWLNQRGIYASAYNHHWRFFQRRCPDSRPSCEPLTYSQALAKLRAAARLHPTTDEEVRLRDESQAVLNSASRDLNGRLRYENYGPYFYKYYVNPDPEFSTGMDWVAAVQKHQVQRALDLAASTGARLDGIHLDSTSGHRRWADDYDRSHWAVADMPLSFSYDSGQVVQRVIFSMYEQLRRMATFLHARDMILSANFNANEALAAGYVGADQIDYFGIEEGLARWDRSVWGVSADSLAMLKRTMAYQRPVTTIDNRIGDGTLTLPQIDRRLQQNLFYGIFEGPRGQVSPTETWATEKGVRETYAKYTPLFRELVTAGWEPVTNARSFNLNVWVERFGYASKHNLYLTLRNETKTAQRYTLTVDLNKDGLRSVGSVAAVERVTGTPVPVTLNAARTQATLSGSIPPDSTRVLKLDIR